VCYADPSGYQPNIDTIVVGYEGSEASERALERAAELAEALRARLVVVSVSRSSRLTATVPVPEPRTVFVPGPAGGAIPPEPMLPSSEPERPEPKELAQQQLEQARMMLARRQVEAEYVAEVGPPAERLLEVADRQHADLLVVGSREHGLVERLLARPVEETVARHAHRDVLLVH
jgi:nucleotide-binding universal stress UspA family protein